MSWYSLSLIYPSIILHLMKKQYGTYNRANSDLIRRVIDLFDWDKALRINDVDKQNAILSDTLMNIMQTFNSYEFIIRD